jgi:hypothetical protein
MVYDHVHPWKKCAKLDWRIQRYPYHISRCLAKNTWLISLILFFVISHDFPMKYPHEWFAWSSSKNYPNISHHRRWSCGERWILSPLRTLQRWNNRTRRAASMSRADTRGAKAADLATLKRTHSLNLDWKIKKWLKSNFYDCSVYLCWKLPGFQCTVSQSSENHRKLQRGTTV